MFVRGRLHIELPARTVLTEGGDPVTVSAPPYAAALVEVSLESELVLISPASSGPVWGRFGPGSAGDYVLADTFTQIFCTKPDGCTCQDGSPLPTLGDATANPSGPSFVAVTGGAAAGGVALRGISVDDLCDDPEQPALPGPATRVPSPVGGCQGNCAGSHGDPHLVTFDGYHYDMQAVGEFVLVRSLDDDLEVQARTGGRPARPCRRLFQQDSSPREAMPATRLLANFIRIAADRP
jgi:hypothetical protein